MPRLKTGLNALATGILLFLFWDVTGHAWEPVDDALSDHDLGAALSHGAVLAVTLGVGLIGLVWVDRFAARAATRAPAVPARRRWPSCRRRCGPRRRAGSPS